MLVAAMAASFVVELIARHSPFDAVSWEAGLFLIPAYLPIAISFGWAGYLLVRQRPNAWRKQFIPLLGILVSVAYLAWIDSA